MEYLVTPEQLSSFKKDVFDFYAAEYSRNKTELEQILQAVIPAIEKELPVSSVSDFNLTKNLSTEQFSTIIKYILGRANTVMMLANEELEWDGEIILRSMLEASLKLLSIIDSEPKELAERLEQYWVTLELFESKRRSDKAKEMIKQGQPDYYFNVMVLSEQDEARLLQHPEWGNQAHRSKIKEAWSFTGILKAVVDRSFIAIPMLSYYYKMASHVAHADATAVAVINERSKREVHHKNLASFANCLKLMGVVNSVLRWHIAAIYNLQLSLNKNDKVREKQIDLNLFMIQQRSHEFTARAIAYHDLSDEWLKHATNQAIKNIMEQHT